MVCAVIEIRPSVYLRFALCAICPRVARGSPHRSDQSMLSIMIPVFVLWLELAYQEVTAKIV